MFRKPSFLVFSQRYMDGGFTNNLPVFEDGFTVRVSPFSGGQEISPQDKRGMGLFFNLHSQDFQLNRRNIARGLHAFFPPSKDTLTKYFNRGYHDAEKFLKSRDFFEPESRITDISDSSVNTSPHNKNTRLIVWRETTV